MRFRAPAREAVERAVFDHPVFAGFEPWKAWLTAAEWPQLAALNAAWPQPGEAERFVAQTAALLADGLHYEQRIAERGLIATRERNWHDLLNALIWLRWPAVKQAMNRRQMQAIARHGSKQRDRAQCALTHFDEAGVLVLLRDPARLTAWDEHDWPALFADLDPAAGALVVVGHALLEHALEPDRLLVGKALVALADDPASELPVRMDRLAESIAAGSLLNDPQELRPLPLMGWPGWYPGAGREDFLRSAPCFQPKRTERRYPPAWP